MNAIIHHISVINGAARNRWQAFNFNEKCLYTLQIKIYENLRTIFSCRIKTVVQIWPTGVVFSARLREAYKLFQILIFWGKHIYWLIATADSRINNRIRPIIIGRYQNRSTLYSGHIRTTVISTLKTEAACFFETLLSICMTVRWRSTE
jgi:hypothetical protein